MIRVKLKRPVCRFRSPSERVDETVEAEMPAPRCHVCRAECEGKAKPDGSYQFKCVTCDVLVMTWSPPVYEPEPEQGGQEGGHGNAPESPPGLSKKQRVALAAGAVATAAAAAAQFLQ